MERKGLMEGLQKNLPDLEEPLTICLLAKGTQIPRGPIICVSNIVSRFMLQIYFAFFNVEIIRGFTSNFLAMCYSSPYQFEFPSREKRTSNDIL